MADPEYGEIYKSLDALKAYLIAQFEDLPLTIRTAQRDERQDALERDELRDYDSSKYPEAVISIVDWAMDNERRTGDPRDVVDSSDLVAFLGILKAKPIPIAITFQLDTAAEKHAEHLCISDRMLRLVNKEKKDEIETASGHKFFIRPGYSPPEGSGLVGSDLWIGHHRIVVPTWLRDESDGTEAYLLKKAIIKSNTSTHTLTYEVP